MQKAGKKKASNSGGNSNYVAIKFYAFTPPLIGFIRRAYSFASTMEKHGESSNDLRNTRLQSFIP